MRYGSLLLTVLSLASLTGLVAVTGESAGGVMVTTSEVTGPQEITVSWTFIENPAGIVDRPEWVGYNVMRRAVGSCTYERLNADVIPRAVGVTHSRTYVDVPSSLNQTYEDKAIPVDAAHAPVYLNPAECDWMCSPPTWASCPPESAPISIGTLWDAGWAMFVLGCQEGCYPPSFYFDGPIADELRTLGLEGSVVKMYGTGFCCSIEGAVLQPTAWEPGECLPTSSRPTSWGRVKTIYR